MKNDIGRQFSQSTDVFHEQHLPEVGAQLVGYAARYTQLGYRNEGGFVGDNDRVNHLNIYRLDSKIYMT
jgi:hypothetical protein